MSFILDALKKSEEERLRQQNPSALPGSAPRSSSRTPPWVWIVLGLLAVNLAILVALLLKPTAATDVPMPAQVPAPAVSSPQAAPLQAQSSKVEQAAQEAAIEPIQAAQTVADVAPRLQPRSSVTVPTRDQQLAAGANLPAAMLNLHVYDSDPTRRFVLLNGERLREGDTSRDGLKTLSITPEGVILSYGGSSFAVSIEGS